VIEACAISVVEKGKGLWDACLRSGNLFIGADGVAVDEPQPVTVQPPAEGALSRTYRAGRLKAPVAIDGDLGEWTDAAEATIALAPDGSSVVPPHDAFSAAYDDEAVTFAFRIRFGADRAPVSEKGAKWGASDGVELAFRNADPKHTTPILMLWLRPDATFVAGRYGGATAEHVAGLQRLTRYAAKRSADGWNCEVRISFEAMGLERAQVPGLKLNATIHHFAEGYWLTWAPTGTACWHVDAAGVVTLE